MDKNKTPSFAAALANAIGAQAMIVIVGAIMLIMPVLQHIQSVKAAGGDVDPLSITIQLLGGFLLAVSGWTNDAFTTSGKAARAAAATKTTGVLLATVVGASLLAGCGNASIAVRANNFDSGGTVIANPINDVYEIAANADGTFSIVRKNDEGEAVATLVRLGFREQLSIVGNGGEWSLRQCAEVALNPVECDDDDPTCAPSAWQPIYCPPDPIPLGRAEDPSPPVNANDSTPAEGSGGAT